MQLIMMHKILMGTAIFGGLSFSAWSVLNWTKTGQSGSLIIAVVGVVGTVGLGLYLKRFIAKTRSDEPR